MSKRNKKMRSNRPAFKLEALEQRQLLATIVGGSGGTEVGSDITVSGKVYDQILMNGPTISVQADSALSQIVRVDFMDADGDIVRAEYSGTGTLTISLANYVPAAAPTKYAISGTKYVQGLATFTITGSDGTSNFLTTSLGSVTAFNGAANPIFANGTMPGGNNTANVARLVIVGDSANLVNGSGSAFGSIFAGNARFGDTAGVVGVYAPNTSFKAGSTITIGDIVPGSVTATPRLDLGAFSDVKSVTVAGGELKSFGTGAVAFTFSNVSTILSTSGTTSGGASLDTKPILSSTGVGTVNYSSNIPLVTIEAGVTQATLDTYVGSYLQDVVINGGLASGLTFRALQFGTLTINGNLAGVITTDADNGNDSDVKEQGIGNVTINGDILDGGYLDSSTSIGNVTVTGKVTHTVTAPTVVLSNVPTATAPAVISTIGRTTSGAQIGNVTFTGDVSLTAAEGLIAANTSKVVALTTGIGTISGANLSAKVTSGSQNIITSGASTQGIGNLTFTGDVVLSATGAATGGGIVSGRGIGTITAKSLTVDTPKDTGIVSSTTSGSIGAITTTGGNLTLTLGGLTSGVAIGNISVNNTGNLVISSPIAAATNIGNITVDSGNLTTSGTGTISTTAGNIGNITLKAGNLVVDKNITAAGGNIGDITLTNTTGSSIGGTTATKISSTVGGVTGLGGTIGNIAVGSTGTGNLTIGVGAASTIEFSKMGNITVSAGDLTFANASGFKNNTAALAGTSIGDVTVSAGKITGVAANIEFLANKIGAVSVTGKTAGADLLTEVNFQAKGITQAEQLTSAIGNITLNNTLGTTGAISKSAVATTLNTGTGFSSSGNIGNVSITTASGGKVIADATSALLIRAGNSEFGADVVTTAGGAAFSTAAGNGTAADAVNSVSIGTISVTANLAAAGAISSGIAASGTGLMILSGVNLNAAGQALTGTNANVTTGTALTAGSIGAITMNDLAGAVTRTAFTSNVLTENNTAAVNGGSVIMADSIGKIIVNTGVELVNVTPTGLALRGAIGAGLTTASTTQPFTGNDVSALFIVVL